MTKNCISNIKTNLITGFLGVGKTSAVLHLMAQKPADETWAVLVNEFGSIGIDGAIYKSKGIEVKEIPSGCMCCAAGVPLQVAINNLIKETRPQRLLIEASGLGHPKRVLDTLQGEHFRKALSLRASICLIDPRNLLNERYTSHENFIDQIAVADVLVANKTDQCDAQTLEHFEAFASTFNPAKLEIVKTQFGKIDASLLDLSLNPARKLAYPDHHQDSLTKNKIKNKDGYSSNSIRFADNVIFDCEKLTHLFESLGATRIKAVLRINNTTNIKTNNNWTIFNVYQGSIEATPTNLAEGNRIEIIQNQGDSAKPVLNEKSLKELLERCIL